MSQKNFDLDGIFEKALAKSGVMDGGKFSHIHEGFIGRELDFMKNVLDVTTWRGQLGMIHAQESIVKSVFANKYTAVYSSRGWGKDFSAARCMVGWFYTRPSRILFLAPSLRQAKSVLMKEVSETFNGSKIKLEGELLTMGLKVSASYYMLGIPAANPDAVRGFHAKPQVPGDPNEDFLTEVDLEGIAAALEGDDSDSMLIVIDEPEGISDEVWRVLEGTLSKKNVHVLLIGNPVNSISDEHFYPKSLLDESGKWYRIKLSTFSEEKYPDPSAHLYDEIFDNPPDWLIPQVARDAAERDYDESDPVFLCDWLGRFSTDEVEAQVVPARVINLAEERYLDNRSRHRIGPRIGIDIGFGGADPCVATLMVNGVVSAIQEWRPHADDPQTQITVAATIKELCIEWGRQVGETYPDVWDGSPIINGRLSIDDSGLSGVGDVLFTMGVECDRVNFGKNPDGQNHNLMGTTKVKNVRTEMYWCARMGLSDGTFFIPNEDRFRLLRQELPWTRYERKHNGEQPVIELELKKEIKKRHKRSPDFADSFVLACRETSRSFAIIETGPLILGGVRRPGEGEASWGSPFGNRKRKRGLGWKRIL